MLVAPFAAFGSDLTFAALPAVMQVTVPEYWGVPDSLAFFVVTLGIFGVLLRSKILRLSFRNGK